jgi:hypothetical protein
VKDTENMVEQRTADVRTVGWSLRQKEILGIVLDVIQSFKSSAHSLNLNAFSVPLINLMSHSDGNPANNTPEKESAREWKRKEGQVLTVFPNKPSILYWV